MEEVRLREAGVADAAGIARVHVDSWRTTYAGIVPDSVLADMSYEQRTRSWEQILRERPRGGFSYVAEAASAGIVGFASGGRERSGDPVYRGELYALYLLAAYQRQGLGRRLVAAVAARLQQEGLTSLLIWVLAENPARHFYESLGGQFVREQPITIGIPMTEVAYGWKDTSTLRMD